jgi:hypothetical protein
MGRREVIVTMRWKISFLSFLWSASVSADAWAWESAFKGTPWEKVEATVTVEDTDPHTGQGQITVALPGDAANYCTGVRWRLFDYWTAELTASERETQPVAGGKTTWTIPVTADDGPYVRLCLEAQDRAGRWWPNCHYLTLSDFTGPRRRMTLDGAWQVLKLGPDQPLQSPITLGTLGTSEGWETLTIPEDICSNATNSAAGKRAWYRRPFTPPETLLSNGRATPPCRLFLGFQGAGFHALVYLNGEQVGEHWLCYLPWEADVTGQVQWGQENELLVGLESVRHAHGSLPFTRDWNGGIYDSVYLVARPAVRV